MAGWAALLAHLAERRGFELGWPWGWYDQKAMRYAFDDFEVDGARLQLFRADEAIAAEPLVLEFVVYVLAHRERLITKDELVEVLWNGKILSDAALSRCIYQARKLLDPAPDGQSYVRTVHGRGVRFHEGVEVREVDDRPPESVPAQERSDFETEPDPSERRHETLGQALPRKQGRSLGLIAAALAAVLLVIIVELKSARPGPVSEVPESIANVADRESKPARPILALLPLATVASQPSSPESERELALVALSLTDLLHTRLAGIPQLETRPLLASVRSATAADSLREAAVAVGATHLVSGSIEVEQDRLVAELTLFEMAADRPARATPLGRFPLPRLRSADDFASLIAARDAMAQRVARLVGSPYVLTDPEPGGTSNAEAWRLYVVAYQRLSDDFCGGSGPAIALLERALELDPEFGLAWEAVGTAYYNRVWACGESIVLHAKAFAALDRAEQVAPTLRNPRLTRITLLIESGQVEKAYERILEEVETYPNDPRTSNAVSYALRYAGFLEPSAAALDRVLELDPLAFVVGTLGGSPNAYLYQGRLEDFLEVVPVSDMAYHRWYRGFTEILLGRAESARVSLEPAFRSSPGQIFGRLAHALLAILDGDHEAARHIVAMVASQRDEMGEADAEITLKQAQILALAGDSEGALASLSRAVDQGFFCVRCLRLDPSLERVRAQPGWEQLVEVARRRHLEFAARFGLEPEDG